MQLIGFVAESCSNFFQGLVETIHSFQEEGELPDAAEDELARGKGKKKGGGRKAKALGPDGKTKVLL